MVLTSTTSDASETNTEAAAASPVAKVHERRFNIVTDNSRDVLLTDFGKETLEDRYLLPGESYQDLFARVAAAYADDQDHAQRLYDYISKLRSEEHTSEVQSLMRSSYAVFCFTEKMRPPHNIVA